MTNELPRFDSDPNISVEPTVVVNPSVEAEQEFMDQFLPYHEHPLEELKEKRASSKVFLIEFGNKSLLLTLDHEDLFTTVILSKKERKKIKGDTTAVYKKAKELMQREADTLSKKLQYTYSTSDPKMIMWGETSGQEIFNWSKKKLDGDLYFFAEINPTPKNQ